MTRRWRVLILATAAVAASGAGATERYREVWKGFSIDYASRMLGSEYRRLLLRTAGHCAYTCSREARCRAFTYNRFSGSCNLIAKVSRQRIDRRYVTGVRVIQHPHARGSRVGSIALDFGQEQPGDGYRFLYVDQAEECATHCDRENACAALRYEPDTRRCTLLPEASPSRPRPGVVSGTKRRVGADSIGGIRADGADAAEQAGFAIRRNTAYFGNDYRHAEQPNRRACLRMCAKDPGCAAFTWQPFSSECFLKSEVPPAKYRKGVVSGFRQTRGAQAPSLSDNQ